MTLATVPTAELVPVESFTVTPDKHPVVVYISGLSEGSRRTMIGALELAAEIMLPGSTALDFPWAQIGWQHVQALRSALAERYSPATANKTLSAVKGTLKAAWRLRMIDSETYHRTVDVERVRGHRLPAGRALPAAEVRALFDAARSDPGAAGARDCALLAIAFGCGLRRAEIAALALDDYDPTTGALRIMNGKGGKQRIAYAPAGARAALDDWLAVRGDEPGPLLLRVRKGGKIEPAGISASAIYLRVTVLAERAGIPAFTPHDARRTFAGDLLDAGGDLASVQRLMGHSSPTTTASYDRRPELAKQRTAELLLIPYTPER